MSLFLFFGNGNKSFAADEFEMRPIQVPLLTNGDSIRFAELSLRLTEPKSIALLSLGFGTETNIANIESISYRNEEGTFEGVIKGGQVEQTFGGPPSASYDLIFEIKIKEGSRLLDKIFLDDIEVTFRDDSKIKAEVAHCYRLARSIHKRGEANCHTFRIPALTRGVDGTLLGVYDMRYESRRDLQGHMDIGLSRSTDGGETWGEPRPIMDMGEYGGKSQRENGCSDPNILVNEKNGEIFVSAVWTHGKPNTHQWVGRGSEPGFGVDETAQFLVVRSRDEGKTWSQPENWTKRLKKKEWWLFAPAPGNGITMKDGTLVMPTQGRDHKGHPFSNLMWSKDGGDNWTLSSAARDNTTECAVAELSDGSLLLNMRDNRNRKDKGNTNGRAVSLLKELGGQWTVHGSDHGALPEPVCMASLIGHDLPDGKRVLLFSNPSTKSTRTRMTIQLSRDDGKSWPEKNKLLLDEKGGAYSSLVMVDPETVGILYESSQADLVFQKIKLSDFLLDFSPKK